ncbi:MAG: response regulator [Candidatus Aminicenantes bacterium]|nr:response regulator [Candidatus Aminicenantes bacterium]
MTNPAKKRILVVDDEATVCRSIRQALLCEEYEIDIAMSGEEALRMAENKDYEVMVVDLMMPGLNGLDLLRSINAKNSSARIIMVTGYPTMKNTLRAMQIGAFDFLPKPFLPSDLRKIVARALAVQDQD